VFLALALAWLAFSGHSGLVQYHMFRAGLVSERTRSLSAAALRQDMSVLAYLGPETLEALSGAESHLRRAAAIGLFADTRISRQRSWLALLRGDSAASVRHLREAIALEPDNPDTYYQLGRVLAVRGEFADAARMFAQADELSRAGGRFKGATERGAGQLSGLGLREEAVRVLEEAVLLRPGSLSLREHLGRALYESGRTEACTDVLQAIVDRWPDQHAVRVQLGELLLSAGSTDEGLAQLKRVLRDRPGDTRANALIGRALLFGAGRPGEAIAHLERAVSASAGNHNLRADLAQAYIQIGEYEKAEVQIRENLKQADTQAGSLYMLGELRQAQGREAEAQELFRRAHALDPRFPAPRP
jgi:tetratricopeptide (TPR) repeat protein